MPPTTIRVLVIDDSALYRKFVSTALKDIPGVEVVDTAVNGRIGIDKIEKLKPDLITLDQEMPELDGIETLRELSARNINVAAIMISSLTNEGAKTTNTALQLGAFDFVLKPVGKSPDESRLQLQADLTPKITAYLASLPSKSKQENLGLAKPVLPGSATEIDRTTCSAGTLCNKPQIVCIGVSTGGPAALHQLLPKLPGDFPCPILVVQHMPPKFTKSLADDLDRQCALDVQEATNGTVAKSSNVYIAPGGSQMRVRRVDGQPVIQITDDPPERNCKPAVDYLFRSIAEAYGKHSLGVILTGMGDDGTIGCQTLKSQGAAIVTQDEASSVVYGMPRSVAEAGLSDRVAPLHEIASLLVETLAAGVTK